MPYLRRGFVVASVLAAAAAIAAHVVLRQERREVAVVDGGGVLRPGLAAYDVQRYDLDLVVDPATQTIRGQVTFVLRVVEEMHRFECDLTDQLEVTAVRSGGEALRFAHRGGRVVAELDHRWSPGEVHAVTVDYGGSPVEAQAPSYFEGFVWRKTEAGKPWVTVSCQIKGADLWWPCKEHPSDEPDEGMIIALTCPDEVRCLSNGRLIEDRVNEDDTRTSVWLVSYPINTYLVTLNLAPYEAVEERYHGVDGDLDVPMMFWALPEHVEAARRTWQQAPLILEVFGRRFGEYPFLDDKFWVAESAYQGMEHQTLIAYGDRFQNNEFGFDTLLLHEMAHEWWGNKVSVADWADFWIHEGLATYSEALYVHDTLGEQAYFRYMATLRDRFESLVPLVQGRHLTTSQAYNDDIYFKGAWVIHTLRWLVGDEAFFRILFRFSTDDRFAYGFVNTTDFCDLVAEETGRDMDWFWRRYLFEADLPRWTLQRETVNGQDRIEIQWQDPYFLMPLPVQIGDHEMRLPMDQGRAALVVERDSRAIVDPNGWVLAEPVQ